MAKLSILSSPSAAPLHGRLLRALDRICAYIGAIIACYREGIAAAELYTALARLSEAERKRRGIAGGDLLRHIRDQLGNGPRDCDRR